MTQRRRDTDNLISNKQTEQFIFYIKKQLQIGKCEKDDYNISKPMPSCSPGFNLQKKHNFIIINIIILLI